ncbi:MAG: metallophosphoesterase [archaeon]
MKLLFFSDTHGDKEALENIKKKSSEVDGLVCAGDISVMERGMKSILRELNNLGKKTLIIHGNHENEENLRDMCRDFENLKFMHKGVYHTGDYVFMGYGGDGFSTNDPEFDKVAKFFKSESLGKKRIIMITHGPPHGTEIDKLHGDYRGSKSYRAFMDDVKPHLFISGHLHENAGKHQKIGRTLLINPGKAGAIVEI